MNRAIYAFVALAGASLLWTHDVPMTWMGYYYNPSGSYITLLLVFFAYLYGSRVKRSDIEDIIPIIGLVLSLGSIIDHCKINPMGNVLQNGRAGSLQGGPVFLGACLAMCIPFCLSLKTRVSRCFYLSMIGTGLIMAMSRGGMVAGIIGGLVYVHQSKR